MAPAPAGHAAASRFTKWVPAVRIPARSWCVVLGSFAAACWIRIKTQFAFLVVMGFMAQPLIAENISTNNKEAPAEIQPCRGTKDKGRSERAKDGDSNSAKARGKPEKFDLKKTLGATYKKRI